MKCFVTFNLEELKECEEVNAILDACHKCEWYYYCDDVMKLNDKLVELEEMEERENEKQND